MKNIESKLTWGGLALLLVIVVSVLSSIVTNIATNNWIDSYRESLVTNDTFRILSMVKPNPLPGTYEESLERVREVSSESLVLLQIKTTDSSRIQDWILKNEAVGVGVIITTDGWVLFHENVLPSRISLLSQHELWISGERYEIIDMISDSLTDFVMVKIDAQNLSALEFGASSDMGSGDILFVVNNYENISATSLSDTEALFGNVISGAEIFTTKWSLDETFESALPLLNSAGAFVGFTDLAGSALPLHHGSEFITSVLRGSESYHVGFGAYVVDVDSVSNIDTEIRYGYKNGALIYSPNSYTSAVIKNSPAEIAGLADGDLILSVDGVVIEKSVTLADLLSKYSSGDLVKLQVVNQDGINNVEVVLSNYEDLLY